MLFRVIATSPYIHGLGAVSALGIGIPAHIASIAAGIPPFRPLAELLGNDTPHAARHAAWIADRALLCHRMWSPASVAALLAAHEAVADARWDDATLGDAALVLATSRGAAAGWLAPWPGRRPFRTFAVSNSIHCEPASAVAIELGIRGPNHVVSSGCAAGLDAIGIAMMLLAAGQADHALVVAVDLPLVPCLLDAYNASGLLSKLDRCDPYGPVTDGLILGEAAAAIAISRSNNRPERPALGLACHFTNSDAANPLATPQDGGRTPELIDRAHKLHGPPTVLCPHATGTRSQAVAEAAVHKRAFSTFMPTVCLLKPWLGHTLGASGLIETVLLAAFLRGGRLPPHPPGVTSPPGSGRITRTGTGVETVCKLAHAIGGHNSLLYLQSKT